MSFTDEMKKAEAERLEKEKAAKAAAAASTPVVPPAPPTPARDVEKELSELREKLKKLEAEKAAAEKRAADAAKEATEAKKAAKKAAEAEKAAAIEAGKAIGTVTSDPKPTPKPTPKPAPSPAPAPTAAEPSAPMPVGTAKKLAELSKSASSLAREFAAEAKMAEAQERFENATTLSRPFKGFAYIDRKGDEQLATVDDLHKVMREAIGTPRETWMWYIDDDLFEITPDQIERLGTLFSPKWPNIVGK